MEKMLLGSLLQAELISILTLLLTIAALAHMLSTRRKPHSMIAWILVIVTMPHIGIPLYILFSGRKIEKFISRKEQVALKSYAPSPLGSEMSRFLLSQDIPPPTEHNDVTICHDAVEAYHNLIAVLKEAERSIYITTFVFGDDEVTREIVAILSQKARAGVDVKLLIDALGSIRVELFPSILRPLKAAGGDYRFFHSFVRHPFDFRINLRNHRKSIIVDGHTVIAGGMNIAREYFAPRLERDVWSDLSFVLLGEATRHYLDIFVFDWEYTTGEKLRMHPIDLPETASKNFVQVVPSGPDVEKDAWFEAMVYAAFIARERIWIVTPYFAPEPTLLDGLRIARHRGVDVRIIVPAISNHPLADLARNGFLRELQEEGIGIYLYRTRMLHAKAVLVDERFVVMGSANFDNRSFFYNYETMAFFYHSGLIANMEGWMEAHMRESTRGLAPAGRIRIIFENIFKMLSPVV